ncbi:hypothetical protein [Phaeovulum vinaykumarii]|uniref:hypothetical protein n=1 Tax=Phaeovulum vinaykumarii TaxID=407234 RepID=UPI001AECCF5E|nr:hypothetical protein [Phaeovulum vinaykumarii]
MVHYRPNGAMLRADKTGKAETGKGRKVAGLHEIGTMWIGPELSWLEQLCLQSFLDAGHEVVLFSYDKVAGVPAGVRCESAESIYPSSAVIRHARTGSPAYHADVFRLHMLAQTDLIWADTDAYCCQPWELPSSGHFHGWISDAKPLVNNGVLRLPKDSATLAAMLEFTSDEYPVPPWLPRWKRNELTALREKGEGVHVSLLPWGVWGPNAVTWFLQQTGEIAHSFPGHVLYPLPFAKKAAMFKPRRKPAVEGWVKDDTLSIHLWGRRFRSIAASYGGVPPGGSYAAMLCARHGIDPAATAHLMEPAPTDDEDETATGAGQG